MKKDDCIFCKIANGEIPSTTIYEDDYHRVFFDIAPASKGHCLIVPKDHYDNIFDLDEQAAGRLFGLAAKVAAGLKSEVGCEGMNIVQNNGEIAGQTVFHFHMHLIPRYVGDTVNVGWKPGEADMDELKVLAQKVGEKLI